MFNMCTESQSLTVDTVTSVIQSLLHLELELFVLFSCFTRRFLLLLLLSLLLHQHINNNKYHFVCRFIRNAKKNPTVKLTKALRIVNSDLEEHFCFFHYCNERHSSLSHLAGHALQALMCHFLQLMHRQLSDKRI